MKPAKTPAESPFTSRRLTLRRAAPLGLAPLCLLLTACAGGAERPDEATPRTAALELTAPGAPFCAEPNEEPVAESADVIASPTTGTKPGDALTPDGLQVNLAQTSPTGEPARLTVRVSFEEDDPNGQRPYVDKVFAGRTVRVQTARIDRRTSGTLDFVTTGGRPLREMELLVGYKLQEVRGERQIGVGSYQVLALATGAQADHFDPQGSYAPTPSTCNEVGILRFGPFPYGMPAVKWPDITGCSYARCADLAYAWLRLHHNVWRANQMFALLDTKHPAQRSYLWSQPGIDGGGLPVSLRSSPAYWYGGFSSERYAAIREVMHDFYAIVTKAKTGSIKLRLQCPDYSSNPGNVCFSSPDVLGHHWVKGWINFCDDSFTDTTCGAPNAGDAVHRVMHHEPLHHVFTHINGLKALRDRVGHGHGATCLSNLETGPIYCEEGGGDTDVRHFVEYGGGCGHHDKVVETVEAHALFIQTIGDMVYQGQMTHWPQPSEPTPTPPSCYADPGCLCLGTDAWTAPDGDDSASSYCPDDDGVETVCMRTQFQAGVSVGVCTRCDEFRGPGCACNDLNAPCDKGFCFGDDTFGTSAGTGTCYLDPPPSWGCLADCERLLGTGAFCMHDHPGGARCVPYGTSLPEADACWLSGGHMDPQELSCTLAPECLNTAGCHALGYPTYFVCDGTLRCMPQP